MEEEEEEMEMKVPQEKLEKVRKSDKLRPFLTNQKLRELIREINGNRNRKKRLWRQLDSDREFRVFIDNMLSEMGYLDSNN